MCRKTPCEVHNLISHLVQLLVSNRSLSWPPASSYSCNCTGCWAHIDMDSVASRKHLLASSSLVQMVVLWNWSTLFCCLCNGNGEIFEFKTLPRPFSSNWRVVQDFEINWVMMGIDLTQNTDYFSLMDTIVLKKLVNLNMQKAVDRGIPRLDFLRLLLWVVVVQVPSLCGHHWSR